MFRTALVATLALTAPLAQAEGMIVNEPIPVVVHEETAGGFANGYVIVVLVMAAIALSQH